MIQSGETDREMLCFSTQGHLFQFTCLSFGLSCAPWVFTKTLKPCSDILAQRARDTAGDGGLEALSDRAFPGPDIPPGIPGLHSSPRDNGESTHRGNRISGNEHSLTNHEASNPATNGKEAPGRSNCPPKESGDSFHSKGSGTPSRKNEFSHTGTPTGSTVLQDNTKRLSPSFGTGQTIIQNPVLAVRPSQGGTLLVGRTHAGVEREKPDPQGAKRIN